MRTMLKSILAAFALVPAAVQAVRSENDDEKVRVYTNKHLRIRFAVPEDGYELRTRGFKYGYDGTLAEFDDKDGQVSGVLEHFKTEKKAAEILANLEKRLRSDKDFQNFRVVQEKKLDRPEGEWLLREYRYETGGDEVHEVRVVGVCGKSAFAVAIWTGEEHWEDRKDEMFRIANSLESGATEAKKLRKLDEDQKP
ncbi:MAG: hypothetical protein HYY17_09550 [Planctomycetes bacterium]|nr:hypothetical protein [Planctomycetota bacterium]